MTFEVLLIIINLFGGRPVVVAHFATMEDCLVASQSAKPIGPHPTFAGVCIDTSKGRYASQ